MRTGSDKKKSKTKSALKKTQTVSEKQFKKIILNVFYSSEEVKNSSKVCSIQLIHSLNVAEYAKTISSCLELKETVDLCQFYIANKSPNVKLNIQFTKTVLNNINELLINMKNDIKPVGSELAVMKHVIDVNNKLLINLTKLYKIV
jgi:hypothetical protein